MYQHNNNVQVRVGCGLGRLRVNILGHFGRSPSAYFMWVHRLSLAKALKC